MAKKVLCGWLLALSVVLGLSASLQAQAQQQKPAAGAKGQNQNQKPTTRANSKPGYTTTDKGPTLDETMNWIVGSLSGTAFDGVALTSVYTSHPEC